jgi:hypothetical protein
MSRKSGALIYTEPLGPTRPVVGDLYLLLNQELGSRKEIGFRQTHFKCFYNRCFATNNAVGMNRYSNMHGRNSKCLPNSNLADLDVASYEESAKYHQVRIE